MSKKEHYSLNASMQLLRMQSFPLALCQMALTFELSEPTALAAGCSLVDSSINSGPKLALTVHKVSAIGQAGTHFSGAARAARLGSFQKR